MLKHLKKISLPLIGLCLFATTPIQIPIHQSKSVLHERSLVQTALLFQSNSAYVTMGEAPELGLTSFTLEAWFKMDGPGGSIGTGSHGIHVYPIISKGYGNADPKDKTLDINYILGIQDPVDGPMVLVADFESTEANPFRNGMNHTIYGVTPIEFGHWHHVAATYDRFEWRMYLDGNLEMRTVHRMVPQYESQHHFGVGASIDNKGVAHGGLKGVIDEVRVWDFARTGQEIRDTLNDEIEQAAGLIGRWGFNEATGSVAYDSSGNDIHGQVVYANWTSNAPMNTNVAPTIVSELCPNSKQNINSVELAISIENPEGDDLEVFFYGREKQIRDNTYTIAVIPDTQHYVRENWWPHHFDATTQWLVDHRDEINLKYVAHVGDIVQEANRIDEWEFADNSISILDSIPDLPYGLTVGNHDEWPIQDPCCTELFNAYFPYSRYEGVVDWYGGHFGDNNDTHHILFSGEGQDYLAIHTEYRNPAPEEAVLEWMEQLLMKYPERKAIIVLHEAIMPGGAGHQAHWDDQGEAVYDRLKQFPNFFMILAGHRHGEGRRVDEFEGNTVYTLMHNFQIRPESGAGYFRILEFAEGDDEIVVKTFTPVGNEYETDPDSQFRLSDVSGGGAWQLLGKAQMDGQLGASIVWDELDEDVNYEWFAEVSDNYSTASTQIKSFVINVCEGDVNQDGDVAVHDILEIINTWGECQSICESGCVGDLNSDGMIGVNDILIIINAWGPCN